LVYSNLCSDLGLDRYLAQPRARDQVLRTGTFHRSDYATLIYHIVVCDHKHILPFVQGHSLAVATFAKWRIAVYSTYLNVPATQFGRFCFPATRPPQTDGVLDPSYPEQLLNSHGTDSLPPDKLLDILLETDNLLAAQLMDRLYTTTPEDKRGEWDDLTKGHIFRFHPNIDSLFAERLGVPPGHTALGPLTFIRW
jgi:hypothetical protein